MGGQVDMMIDTTVVHRDHENLKEPEMQERRGKLGMQDADTATDPITAFAKREVAKWAQVIKSENIKLE